MHTIRLLLAALTVAVIASLTSAFASDRSGWDAAIPSTRAPGGYSNFCQTWAVDVPRVRKLFGACTS